MLILLAEVSPDDIRVDESLFPDTQKDSFIYEHLRYFISKLGYLPVIEIKVYGNSAVVVKGHLYALIAKELGYGRIRVRILEDSFKDNVKKFLQKPSIIQLDWEVIKKEGNDILVEYIWLVFFFQRSLNQQERNAFEQMIVAFYENLQLPTWAEIPKDRIKNLNYSYSGYCAEFQAYVPIEDERWYAYSKAAIVNFHLKYVPIVSYQGRRFQIN